MKIRLFLIFLGLCASQSQSPSRLEVVNQWTLFDFNFPYDNGFLSAFRPENTVFTGLEVTQDRLFVAIPRIWSGVPATVAVLPRRTTPGSSPVLTAYPNWSFHAAGRGNVSDCNGLTSVYRLRKDACNRLWLLDAGVLNSLEDFRPVCPPKIVIVDLHTDQVVRQVVFPREVLRPSSLLTNLVIDESVQGKCDSAFAYITDTAVPGIIVYDGSRDTAWRHTHATMYPDPDYSDTTVNGETFTLMDGIIGLAHSPQLQTLYYQPLATEKLYSVSTAVLRQGPPAENFALPVNLVGRKSSQGVGLACNPNDEWLYFSPVTETSVTSWNPLSNDQKLIEYNPDLLQFPAEIRWIDEDGSLWLVTTRFQKFIRRTINSNEINLRIVRIPIVPTVGHAGLGNSILFK